MTDATAVTRCRGCRSGRLRVVLDLGEQPACDYFPAVTDPGPDPRWPLALTLCTDCFLLQLSHDSPAPQEPLALESATLKRHAVEVTDRLLRRLGAEHGLSVREFASHHGGSWMPALTDAGCLEVESGADVVIDNQSIIHSEDLEADLAERVAALSDDGALVIEFHHALAQLSQGQFDTVRHGHPLYFSLTSWQAACERHDLSVVDAWPEDVFGGCLVVVARRGNHAPGAAVGDILAQEAAAGLTHPGSYRSLRDQLERTVADLRRHLTDSVAAGRTVAAYGAGSKACTLLGVAEIGADLLPMVADLAPGKQGRRVPGGRIPIVSPEDLVAAAPDEVLVLTWDIADEVTAQLRGAGLTRARFVAPLPTFGKVRSGPGVQSSLTRRAGTPA